LLAEGRERGELFIEDPLTDARTMLGAYVCYSPPLLFQLRIELLREDLPRLNRMILRGLLKR